MTSEIVVFLGLRISLTVFDKKFLSLMLLQLLREDLVVLPYLPKLFDHYLHLLFLLPNALKIGIVFIASTLIHYQTFEQLSFKLGPNQI